MLGFLPYPLIGFISFLLLIINILLTACILFPATLIKICLPFKWSNLLLTRLLNKIANDWVYRNNLAIAFTRKINWHVTGLSGIDPDGKYLLISNHQSWVDIVVLQKVFHGYIPFIKFFLKKELLWVPIMGPAWWALDFPFMKRYSKEFLAKHPHLKGKDIEITRKACEKFRLLPVTVMNFLEGTRLTPEKKERQNSPYRHLLKPKSGGMGFVLSAMGDQLTGILDTTIVYPKGSVNFWPFLCGLVRDIWVDVRLIPLSDELKGDYIEDSAYQERFQGWVNSLWKEKDDRIDEIKKSIGIND